MMAVVYRRPMSRYYSGCYESPQTIIQAARILVVQEKVDDLPCLAFWYDLWISLFIHHSILFPALLDESQE